MAGDFYTILYAFMVLFTGSLSDIFDRKLFLCGACFGWTACTYLSSFAINFHQLLVLRLIMSFFTALSGPCSYSLITDWI
jgi:MFS family permease